MYSNSKRSASSADLPAVASTPSKRTQQRKSASKAIAETADLSPCPTPSAADVARPASWILGLKPSFARKLEARADVLFVPNPGSVPCKQILSESPEDRPKYNLTNTPLISKSGKSSVRKRHRDACSDLKTWGDLQADIFAPTHGGSLNVLWTHLACVSSKSYKQLQRLAVKITHDTRVQLARNAGRAPPLEPPAASAGTASHRCGRPWCSEGRHLAVESAGDNARRDRCRGLAQQGIDDCGCTPKCMLGWAFAEVEAQANAMQEREDEDVKPALLQSSSASAIQPDEANSPHSRQPVNSSLTRSACSTSNRPVRSTRSDASYHGTDGTDNQRDSDYVFDDSEDEEDEEYEDEDRFSRQPRTSTASAGPSSSTSASSGSSRTVPLPSPPPGVAYGSAAYDKWASALFSSHGVSIWFQATQAAKAAAALVSPSPASPSHPTLTSPSRTLSSANKGPSTPPLPAPPAGRPYPSPLDSPTRSRSDVNFAPSTSTTADVIPDSQADSAEEEEDDKDDEDEETLASTAADDDSRGAPSPSPTLRKPRLRPAPEEAHIHTAVAAAEGDAAEEPSSRFPGLSSGTAQTVMQEDSYPTLFGAPPEWPSPAPFPPPTIASDSPGPSTSSSPTLRPALVPLDSSDSLGAPPSQQQPQERIESSVEAAGPEKLGIGASSGDASAFPSPPRTPTRALSPAPTATNTLRHASPFASSSSSSALDTKQSGSSEPDAALVEVEQRPEQEHSAPAVPMDLEEPMRVESAAPALAVEEESPRESFAFRAQSEPASEVGDEEWCDAMEEIEAKELVPMSEAAVDYAAAAPVGALEESGLEKEEDEAMQSTEKTEASRTWRGLWSGFVWGVAQRMAPLPPK